MTARRGAGLGETTNSNGLLAPGERRLRALGAKASPIAKEVRPPEELSAMLAFVEALAQLAADLWLEGRLDDIATIEDPPDHDA